MVLIPGEKEYNDAPKFVSTLKGLSKVYALILNVYILNFW